MNRPRPDPPPEPAECTYSSQACSSSSGVIPQPVSVTVNSRVHFGAWGPTAGSKLTILTAIFTCPTRVNLRELDTRLSMVRISRGPSHITTGIASSTSAMTFTPERWEVELDSTRVIFAMPSGMSKGTGTGFTQPDSTFWRSRTLLIMRSTIEEEEVIMLRRLFASSWSPISFESTKVACMMACNGVRISWLVHRRNFSIEAFWASAEITASRRDVSSSSSAKFCRADSSILN
mmetsp:Transcript_6217/g.14161  ORF Transcript_6217/g.14161 Transcript_6217/m.14161 type:complete len:233 (-) Transcript_6217:1764-2462(-)